MIKKIIILIIMLFITACGFKTSKVTNDVNFEITGNQELKNIIRNKLNHQLKQNLKLAIIKVSKNNHNSVYQNSQVTGYDLQVVVDFEVYKDKKRLLKKQLSQIKYLPNIENVNDYQNQQHYNDIQNDLAIKIIRIMRKLKNNNL